ncbi:hypothetical protein BDR04DRAFT_232176 [Suillus decipiens]|nr:hypothetical protein BDR04DRAFT_232176 [Suillus decipiens]
MVLLLFLMKRSCSSALPQLAECLVQKVCVPDGGVHQVWNYLDVISRVLELGLCGPASLTANWMLDVYSKIYSRVKSSKQNSSTVLQTVERFRFSIDAGQLPPAPTAPTDPAWLWQHQISWQCNSHSSEDFDWLVDYLGDVCSNDYKTAGDILILLSSMRVSCSPAKQRLYIEKLIACMGSSMPPRLRHAALRAAHSFREVLASINVDDPDMVLTTLSPAILTAVCPQPGATPTDDGPDCFFHDERDLCYLELIFALARNSYWRPHLHCQMDRAIRIIAECCDLYGPHAFYLVGFFIRMTPEEVPTSSITEQQWCVMMRKAWYYAYCVIDDTRCVEFLSVLVEETKKHKGIIDSGYVIGDLIRDVDDVVDRLEDRGQRDVEELRSMAKGMLDGLSK